VLNCCSPVLLWWGASTLIAGTVAVATKKKMAGSIFHNWKTIWYLECFLWF
jgi:hypothetical protein